LGGDYGFTSFYSGGQHTVVATKVGQLSFTIFHLFLLNIVPRIFWNCFSFHLCKNLLPIVPSHNKLKTCIINSKLWWFGIWTLWKSTTCQRFWITRIATCKEHHLIKRTWPMFVEFGMHMKGLYLFLMGHCITLSNTRFSPKSFLCFNCALCSHYVAIFTIVISW